MTNEKFSSTIQIGRKLIGPGQPTYIIFEVASTHANDWTLAQTYVEQARASGADAVKFQLFKADELLNPLTPGLKTTYDFFKKSETPKAWFPKLVKLCKKAGIDLLCTPFDEDSAAYLNKVGIPAVKIASGDLTNHPLLSFAAKLNKPMILSTGMATLAEVSSAINVIKRSGCKELSILQCTSVYPTPYEAVNLKAMRTLGKNFRALVGYSDNGSKGILVPLAAVALGASIIEKHVTSQKKRGNFDDVFSLSLEEFAEMVKRVREIEKEFKGNKSKALASLKKEFGKELKKVLGDGIKKPAEKGFQREDGVYMTEWAERHWARRGLYPLKAIKKGTVIKPQMLISLRPDVGISALSYEELAGKVALEDLPINHPLKLDGQGVRKFTKLDIKTTYPSKEDINFTKTLNETALFD